METSSHSVPVGAARQGRARGHGFGHDLIPRVRKHAPELVRQTQVSCVLSWNCLPLREHQFRAPRINVETRRDPARRSDSAPLSALPIPPVGRASRPFRRWCHPSVPSRSVRWAEPQWSKRFLRTIDLARRAGICANTRVAQKPFLPAEAAGSRALRAWGVRPEVAAMSQHALPREAGFDRGRPARHQISSHLREGSSTVRCEPVLYPHLYRLSSLWSLQSRVWVLQSLAPVVQRASAVRRGCSPRA